MHPKHVTTDAYKRDPRVSAAVQISNDEPTGPFGYYDFVSIEKEFCPIEQCKKVIMVLTSRGNCMRTKTVVTQLSKNGKPVSQRIRTSVGMGPHPPMRDKVRTGNEINLIYIKEPDHEYIPKESMYIRN